MRNNSEREIFGVIGLGRFGLALAKKLAEAGREVLAIDNDPEKIRIATAFTDNAFTVGTLSKETLEEVGINKCDTVVICIGERLDTSIFATMTVLKLGVRRVISKATSAEHGEVLTALGAEVVYPERDMAVRLGNKLIAPRIMEYISLSDEVDITEIRLTPKVDQKTVLELNLRKAFGLNIIAVNHAGAIETEILPDTLLCDQDSLVVIGKPVNIRKFEKYLAR